MDAAAITFLGLNKIPSCPFLPKHQLRCGTSIFIGGQDSPAGVSLVMLAGRNGQLAVLRSAVLLSMKSRWQEGRGAIWRVGGEGVFVCPASNSRVWHPLARPHLQQEGKEISRENILKGSDSSPLSSFSSTQRETA